MFVGSKKNTIWLCPEWGYTFSREIQVIYLRVSGSLYPLYPFAALKTRNSAMSSVYAGYLIAIPSSWITTMPSDIELNSTGYSL